MRVYSGALNTTIICNALNACKGMVLYAGDVQIGMYMYREYSVCDCNLKHRWRNYTQLL